MHTCMSRRQGLSDHVKRRRGMLAAAFCSPWSSSIARPLQHPLPGVQTDYAVEENVLDPWSSCRGRDVHLGPQIGPRTGDALGSRTSAASANPRGSWMTHSTPCRSPEALRLVGVLLRGPGECREILLASSALLESIRSQVVSLVLHEPESLDDHLARVHGGEDDITRGTS